ncbi:organic solvent tolerance protein, partial [Thauera sp. 63]
AQPAPATRSAPAPRAAPASAATDAARAGTPPASAPRTAVERGPAPKPVASQDPSLAAGDTLIKAQRILGTRSVELVADGDAELQRDDTVLTADRVTYREPVDEAVAEGNVVLRAGQDTITGPKATLVIGESTGQFDTPAYTLTRDRAPTAAGESARPVSGSGSADVLRLEGENQYRLKNATWSTCQASDPDWYIKARELELDYDRQVGTAQGGSIVFQDVPIFWMPWAEFPLSGQRQSGLLPPTFGSSNKTGADLAVPYYWNIAPNYDATITPRLMSRRGMQLGGEFRYLNETYRGESRVEWMAKDNLTGEERRLASIQHQHRITPQLYATLDFNSVSDDTYFEDLSSRIGTVSTKNLLRQATLSYTGGQWWRASARVQSYQPLSPDPDSKNYGPYRRVPQLLFSALRPDLPLGLNAKLDAEFVRFEHKRETNTEGDRLTAYPSLSLPLQGSAWFLTPKVGAHLSQYTLDRPVDHPNLDDSITRSVPITSVDAGLIFERQASFFGSDFLQTLEPRLYYLNVPYRDQAQIPLFDTSEFDVGFAQMFAENRYSGKDRIGDANDLTAAVTSRLIDAETGVERLRAIFGQRYYFDDQRVTRNYLVPRNGSLRTVEIEEPRTSSRADILAGLGGRISKEISVDSYLQYNPSESSTERFNANVRYQPDYAKVLNVSYRYAPNARLNLDGFIIEGMEDVDVSGQWPIGNGWYGVGRVTRSLLENRVTEAVGGLEYDGGCWAFRVAVHRFAIERDDVSQAIYVQLELNDLAGIGSNPLSLLTRSVPGYGKINASSADRVFGVD